MPSWVWIIIVLLLTGAVVGSVVRARGGAEALEPAARREPTAPDAGEVPAATPPVGPGDTGTQAARGRRSRSDYGAGSALPGADGFGPEGWTIKGNIDSMLFHTRESPGFSRMRPAVWFEDEASAEAAGFLRWDHNRRDDNPGDDARRDHGRRG